MRDLPTKEELSRALEKALEIHREYLSKYEVKFPKKETNKEIWLAMLMHYAEQKVYKDEITRAVLRENPEAGHDQQIRHLKRDGWNIEGGREKGKGFHILIPYQPSQEYMNQQTLKRKKLEVEDFTNLKSLYGNKCATCGCREGQPDPRYGSARVHLQQGHRDPDIDSTDKENIIPQCQFCNQAYKRDFVFDDKGRVRAVADIGPIQRARKSVQKKIYKWLEKNLI